MMLLCFLSSLIFEVISIVVLVLGKKSLKLVSIADSSMNNDKCDICKMNIYISNIFFLGGLTIIIGIILSKVINEKILSISLILSILFIIIRSIFIYIKRR